MELVNVHVINRNNVGDANCAPLQYFSFPGNVSRIVELQQWREVPEESPIVIGGGGILHGGFQEEVKSLIQSRGSRSIFWGGGVNDHGTAQSTYPDCMRGLALVGVRDWGRGLPWVPCPSCMSPLFDVERLPTRDIVIYDHFHFPVPVRGFDRLTNRCQDLGQVLSFLGSGETVLTSSYHGAYWATLLGRRVLAFPFSSKFRYFKHYTPLASEHDWKDVLHRSRVHPSALHECREENRGFFLRVRDFLEHFQS